MFSVVHKGEKSHFFFHILILTEKHIVNKCKEARLDCCFLSGVEGFAWLYDQEIVSIIFAFK